MLDDLFREIYFLVESNKYEKALEIISYYKNNFFSEKDISKIFYKECIKNDYLKKIIISGSGGSKIIKPNITTILCSHLSKILCNKKYIIIKTGSKKYTGCKGSSDFIKDIKNLNFLYFDQSVFNKSIQILRFNKYIDLYCKENYFSQYYYDKKIIFSKDFREIRNKKFMHNDIKIFKGGLNNVGFDEITPEYYESLYIKNNSIEKHRIIFKTRLYDYKVINAKKIEILNNLLLKGEINNYWGNILIAEIIECLIFIKNINYKDAISVVTKYFGLMEDEIYVQNE